MLQLHVPIFIQIKWCSQVFSEAVPIVVDLLTESFSTLDPALPPLIATYLQSHGEGQPVAALIQLKQVSQMKPIFQNG